MYQLKTKPTDQKIEDFLNSVPDEKKREDSFKIYDMMREVTGEEGKMWGPSIIGFGSYHYKYESGHEGDMCKIGFSPRKQNLSIYIDLSKLKDPNSEAAKKLGKFKSSVACLYVKKLEDVEMEVLRELVKESWEK